MKSVIETFKPVRGYEGLYEVSDYGCVRSLKFGKVRYLKNAKTPKGYEFIYLSRDGNREYLSVHRLIWEAFVGPIPEGYEIDHINTVRNDNRLDNLRCVTHKENHANPITAERNREAVKRRSENPQWREAVKRRSENPKWLEATREANRRKSKKPQWREAVREGNRNRCNKPVLQLDMVTSEVIREWECARDAWRELGINFSSISDCCHGKRKSAGGFKWKFA